MRRSDREVTELQQILRIVDGAKILHLGLLDEGCPYVVPMHYGYEYKDGALIFYLHGAREGHKLDLIRRNPSVCVELECETALLSGGDDPCRYSAAFASVIGRGRAELPDDPAQKAEALRRLMLHQTGRDFVIRPEMTAAVAVIRLVIPDFTAKQRRA